MNADNPAENDVSPPVRIRRVNDGEPILRPVENWWESGVTFNAAVARVTATDVHGGQTLRGLLGAGGLSGDSFREIVAVVYRGRPRTDPGYLMTRSHVGLALFDAGLRPVHRFREPLLSPATDPHAPDYLGVEDPRVTRIDDKYVMVYCGCGQAVTTWSATLCTAESADLVNWRKCGPIDLRLSDDGRPPARHVNNKDGVLLPERTDGWYHLLHRPMIGPLRDWSIHLARSRSLDGPWQDLGPILRAHPEPGWTDTWIGAGTVPLPMGDGRYLEIYHSGHRAADGSRLYTLGATVLNLARMDPSRPESVVESRLDHFMKPETRWEIEGPYPDSVGNVVFACGAYEREGDIRIIYGGGDTYVMAADVSKAELLAALQASRETVAPSKIVCREN